jgi:hypothetical protein
VVVNGNMVISNNGWTICTSSGELYELGRSLALHPTKKTLKVAKTRHFLSILQAYTKHSLSNTYSFSLSLLENLDAFQ